MKRWNQLSLAILMAVSALGQTTSKDYRPLLLGASVPSYPPIWRAAHIAGHVIVRVTVRGGRVARTDIQSSNSYLDKPTISNLRTWRFASAVNDTFTVTYTYEVSGEESEEPMNPKVEMPPSLDVKITARPARTTCSDCPRASRGLPAVG